MIKFGTDGWIGIISHDFTFQNLTMVIQAVASYLLEIRNGWIQDKDISVIIGYDTRFMSDEYARSAALVLAGNGIKTYLCSKPVITPVLSYAVTQLKTRAGVMITAGHKSHIYNGVKLKGSHGGPALSDMASEVESYIGRDVNIAEEDTDLITLINPDEFYIQRLRKLVDIDLIRRSGLKVIVDVMYGAGKGYIKDLLSGSKTHIIEMRNTVNPSFGGTNPEPIGENLRSAINLLPGFNADLALALDGEGDQLGVVDDQGKYVDSHYIFSLLIRHLVEYKKMGGGVVKTFSTTRMIDRLAEKYNLQLYETPAGFTYITDLFLREKILIGGEESGGFGFQRHIPEKDGILAGLFLLELLAMTQIPLSTLVDQMKRELGVYVWKHLDIPLSNQPNFTNLTNFPIQLAGKPVEEIREMDGVKFCLKGGSWLLVRPAAGSNLCFYAEGSSSKEVEDILHAGTEFYSGYVRL